MEPRIVNVTVTRCDPSQSPTAHEQTFRVSVSEGMTVLQALDYIYEHLDPTLAYYDHGVCAQGTCKRCLLLVDGEIVLACRRRVTTDVHVAPLAKFRVVKDLVYERAARTMRGSAAMSADMQVDTVGGKAAPPTVKSIAEVELLRAAARVGITAMRVAFTAAEAGVPLCELERAAFHAATEAGADTSLVMSLEAGSKLTGAPCPVDPERRLERGDLVCLQLTGTLLGYCFQRSEVRVVGAATEEQQAFLDHLDEASRWIAEVMRAGEELEFVRTESRGRTILPAAHGIGRRPNEVPVIESNRRFALRPGQVLVVEPVVASRDLGRATASQTIVVLETGTEVLGVGTSGQNERFLRARAQNLGSDE